MGCIFSNVEKSHKNQMFEYYQKLCRIADKNKHALCTNENMSGKDIADVLIKTTKEENKGKSLKWIYDKVYSDLTKFPNKKTYYLWNDLIPS